MGVFTVVLFNLCQKQQCWIGLLRYKSLKSWEIDNIDLTQQLSLSIFTDFHYQSIKITWLLSIFIDTDFYRLPTPGRMPMLWKLKTAWCFEPVKIVKFMVPRIWSLWKKKIIRFCPRARWRRQSPTGLWWSPALTEHLVRITTVLKGLVRLDFLIWIKYLYTRHWD